MFGRQPSGRAHEDRGVRPEQQVAPAGDLREHALEFVTVAAVVFNHKVRGAGEGMPDVKPLRCLSAELREPSGQREAGADPQGCSQGASPHVHLVAEAVPVGCCDRLLHL